MSEADAALAVIVAAGSSRRMGTGTGPRKPFLEVCGRSVLEHVCAAFDASPGVTVLAIAVHPEDAETIRTWCATRPVFRKVRAVVPGGRERMDSVRNACDAVFRAPDGSGSGLGWIGVHDAARPCITSAAIERVFARARECGAALLALPVGDTLKRQDDQRSAAETIPREGLWAAQTPQVFRAERFRELLERAQREGFTPTDDAALWERYVGPVAIEPGEPTNGKITRPADLELVRAILQNRERVRASAPEDNR